ncbi:hypothetical protein Tco_1213912 [Tanacetum coccineum]
MLKISMYRPVQPTRMPHLDEQATMISSRNHWNTSRWENVHVFAAIVISDPIVTGDPTRSRTTRRIIDFQNLDGINLPFVIWNETAENFDMVTYAAMEKPVVIVVSSTWVTKRYGDFINPVHTLQVQRQRCSTEQEEQMRNRYSLESLLNINPQHYQRIKFTTEATFVEISSAKGCTILCSYPVVNGTEDKDTHHVPDALNQVENTTHIFQYHFGKGARPWDLDFTLDAVFKPTTQPLLSLLSPQATTPPSSETLQQTTSIVTTTTTPNEATPSAEHSGQKLQNSQEETKKTTKRELFKETEVAEKKPRQQNYFDSFDIPSDLLFSNHFSLYSPYTLICLLKSLPELFELVMEVLVIRFIHSFVLLPFYYYICSLSVSSAAFSFPAAERDVTIMVSEPDGHHTWITLEFLGPAFEAAVQRAVDALLPGLTTRLTNEICQNGAEGSGDQPPTIHTWLESYKLEGDAINWWKAFKQPKRGGEYVATLSWKDFRDILFLQYFPRFCGYEGWSSRGNMPRFQEIIENLSDRSSQNNKRNRDGDRITNRQLRIAIRGVMIRRVMTVAVMTGRVATVIRSHGRTKSAGRWGVVQPFLLGLRVTRAGFTCGSLDMARDFHRMVETVMRIMGTVLSLTAKGRVFSSTKD